MSCMSYKILTVSNLLVNSLFRALFNIARTFLNIYALLIEKAQSQKAWHQILSAERFDTGALEKHDPESEWLNVTRRD